MFVLSNNRGKRHERKINVCSTVLAHDEGSLKYYIILAAPRGSLGSKVLRSTTKASSHKRGMHIRVTKFGRLPRRLESTGRAGICRANSTSEQLKRQTNPDEDLAPE